MGTAAYSPRLNVKGNFVGGVIGMRQLSDELDLQVFERSKYVLSICVRASMTLLQDQLAPEVL